MNRIQLRSTLMKLMLGCLIVAAAVAVLAILIGDFNDTTGRALGTVFIALLHIGVVFGLVSITAPKDEATRKSSDFVVNASIIIAVLSFFTSVFGIWEVVSGELVGKLFFTYVVVLFVLLHGKTLLDLQVVYDKVKPYVYANYVFIAVVAVMILGLVYSPDRLDLLSGFYGRLLAASAIIDVTLGVVVAVMHRLYLQHHPELQKKEPSQAHSGVRIVLVILFFFFILWPLSRLFFGLF